MSCYSALFVFKSILFFSPKFSLSLHPHSKFSLTMNVFSQLSLRSQISFLSEFKFFSQNQRFKGFFSQKSTFFSRFYIFYRVFTKLLRVFAFLSILRSKNGILSLKLYSKRSITHNLRNKTDMPNPHF